MLTNGEPRAPELSEFKISTRYPKKEKKYEVKINISNNHISNNIFFFSMNNILLFSNNITIIIIIIHVRGDFASPIIDRTKVSKYSK